MHAYAAQHHGKGTSDKHDAHHHNEHQAHNTCYAAQHVPLGLCLFGGALALRKCLRALAPPLGTSRT